MDTLLLLAVISGSKQQENAVNMSQKIKWAFSAGDRAAQSVTLQLLLSVLFGQKDRSIQGCL